ncbi:adenylate/guanylate cyclase domain-containing protein [Cupriavidus taiwanensis]|uniref:ATP synthase subunit beta n=1 Tax=Cupriavidus taiwanensis TaxID=164546 RepID=A0A375JBG7_9BURK|nr:adenylate/guanylate cyclase domain-containing protein [Cupriavidus taiwanensis]SPS02437.1 ATP synthase subunit beta [Cupriavidus taiwanensis]
MRCTKCGFDNPTGGFFCEACGQSLTRLCPRCGHESGADAKYCGLCGAALPASPAGQCPPVSAAPAFYTPPHLAERILAEQAAMEARGQADGERKTITALFADIAGSTALIQNLDPEDARELIDPVVALMMEAVHHYEGYVAKFLGDGILALFGAPIAHEDHPLRALYAALRMQQAMHRHNDRAHRETGLPLLIRVGVHTGEVVVRSIRKDDLRTDYDPVGHTIHIASRMEGVATPSSILVSEATHRLTEGYFEFRSLGTTSVKGIQQPLAVYEVVGAGVLRTRLQVAVHRGLARFFGRQAELQRLQEALDSARQGHGRVVGVAGEAGVGKSRLFHEFKARAQQGCKVLETFSVSHGKAFPYLPLIDLLKAYFDIAAQDDDQQIRDKVNGRLLAIDCAPEELLPYLLYLLGAREWGSALPMMEASVRRQRTFDAIVRLLVCESEMQPLMVLFDDLQWLDSETEAFLNVLADQVPRASILLLVNYRPEYAQLAGIPCHLKLHLEPLGQADAQGFLTALLGDHASLESLKREIQTKTEGNPFFMEEVVTTLAEENVLHGERGNFRLEQSIVSLHIPTTVQGVLASRIDRLSPVQKESLQTLAIIGKEFTLSLVRQVTALPDQALHAMLGELQTGDFIYERPAFPELEYAFKHALTQEVAASSLLSDRRSALHERTARAMEMLFPGSLTDYCSELAHHYSKSGNTRKAIEYLGLAGQRAARHSAQREAIRHFNDALQLLGSLPDSPDRARDELNLLLNLGIAYITARGHGAPEVETIYTRALALCEQGAATPQRFSAQLGLWSFYLLRGQLLTAQALAEGLHRLAEDSGDPEQAAEAQRMLGVTRFRRGEIVMARTHLEQALALHRPAQHAYAHLLRYARNPAVHMRSSLSWVLWYLGLSAQACARSEEAIALARQATDPFGLTLSLTFAAELHQRRRDTQRVLECAEAAIALSEEHGFQLYLSWGTILRGWALAAKGSPEDSIALMRRGFDGLEASGAVLGRPSLLGLLADAYRRDEDGDAALRVLGEALAMVANTDERFDEPALIRLKGEVLLQMAGEEAGSSAIVHEAEACFGKAMELARDEGANAIEFRCAVSLADLWHRQGKDDAARRLLARVQGLCTEDMNSVDWNQARQLQEELS